MLLLIVPLSEHEKRKVCFVLQILGLEVHACEKFHSSRDGGIFLEHTVSTNEALLLSIINKSFLEGMKDPF